MPDSSTHELRKPDKASRLGGLCWSCRGAQIHANEQGTLFALKDQPPGLPSVWNGFGNKQRRMQVLDAWLDHRTLPPGYRLPAGT